MYGTGDHHLERDKQSSENKISRLWSFVEPRPKMIIHDDDTGK
jgi:hypothetical protein